mmetsp:Transcript_88440/g.222594  ORF Transcript_88440/g.222594 Transcript_88440/m.222594 type:complete len:370 (+) Transcript_88440:1423-2532(+)
MTRDMEVQTRLVRQHQLHQAVRRGQVHKQLRPVVWPCRQGGLQQGILLVDSQWIHQQGRTRRREGNYGGGVQEVNFPRQGAPTVAGQSPLLGFHFQSRLLELSPGPLVRVLKPHDLLLGALPPLRGVLPLFLQIAVAGVSHRMAKSGLQDLGPQTLFVSGISVQPRDEEQGQKNQCPEGYNLDHLQVPRNACQRAQSLHGPPRQEGLGQLQEQVEQFRSVKPIRLLILHLHPPVGVLHGDAEGAPPAASPVVAHVEDLKQMRHVPPTVAGQVVQIVHRGQLPPELLIHGEYIAEGLVHDRGKQRYRQRHLEFQRWSPAEHLATETAQRFQKVSEAQSQFLGDGQDEMSALGVQRQNRLRIQPSRKHLLH